MLRSRSVSNFQSAEHSSLFADSIGGGLNSSGTTGGGSGGNDRAWGMPSAGLQGHSDEMDMVRSMQQSSGSSGNANSPAGLNRCVTVTTREIVDTHSRTRL